MEKITDKIAALAPDANYFSLEYFPPKTQEGFANLQGRLQRMSSSLKPLFVTVTWGAGGSTAVKSLELAEVCQRQLGLTTCLHLTCTNMNRTLVDEALQEAKALGLRNILALRGDPPRPEEYHVDGEEDSNKDFRYAVDLVKYIRKHHGDYFCIGVAGYPEGHADDSHPEPELQSVDSDMPYLVEKFSAGADFIMTQLTYDIEAYAKYETTLRSHPSGLFSRIPIIPGLMPIQSYQIIKRITSLSHAKIPSPILSRIEAVRSDDEAVKRVGVDVLSEMVEDMKVLPQPDGLPRGLHFYTLNLEKSVAFILERCNLITTSTDLSPSDSSDSDTAVTMSKNDTVANMANGTSNNTARFSRKRASSINAGPHNRVITERSSQSHSHSRRSDYVNSASSSQTHEAPDRGTGIPASNPTRMNNLLISEGQGSLGREATWDDFPNGRWGPSNSPAFGEIDGYGPSLKVGPVASRRLWGHPKKKEDITEIFRRHVMGELQCVPWSDETDITSGAGALREETVTIRKELLALIEKEEYWTLASQPAVNGVKSGDKVFGWGPPGEGFVFQKPFLEFFVSKSSWNQKLRSQLQKYPEEEISWLKTDVAGDFESSISLATEVDKTSSKQTPGISGVNAVTWGVFRGKEVVTPTIIEEQSFRAWGEEAFRLFKEWSRVFPRGSKEEQFLDQCQSEVCLVNVVGQKFVGEDGGRLWDILAGKELDNEV